MNALARAAHAYNAPATARDTVVNRLLAAFREGSFRDIRLPNVKVARPVNQEKARQGILYLYDTHGDRDYLGAILPDGTTRIRVALAPVIKDELREFVTRGHEYLAEVGIQTGVCAYCSKQLTDEVSIKLGYGPVCAKRNNLPHKYEAKTKAQDAGKEVQNSGSLREKLGLQRN